MCKISVVVPVYNAEDTLEAALSSVFMQTLTEIEILCINDGSTDHSAEILTEAQRRDGRVRCIAQENGGAGAARNKGINEAKGAYIAFLDADDCYPGPYALETLYSAAENNNAVICGGSIEKVKGKDVHPMFVFTEEGFRNAADEPLDRYFTRFIYKREFLLENNLYFPPLRVYEDPIFLLCALLKAKEYYAVPDIVYRYSGTHSGRRITLDCTKDYLRGLIAELKLSKKKELPEIHALCCDRLMREADFYAQRFLKTEDAELFSLLLEANAAVSTELLKEPPEGDNVILPALRTVWHAGCRYLRWRDQRIIRTLCDVFAK